MALVTLCLSLITFELSKYGFKSQFAELQSVLVYRDSCATLTGKHNDKLVFATQTETMARELLGLLCKNQTVSQQFGTVEANWMPDEAEMLEYVGEGKADLVMVKQNFMVAFQSDVVYAYDEIATYTDYSAFFIGLKEKPQLNKEYLLGKRIGILDYASSRSGHIAPLALLKSLDLDEHQVQLIFAQNHQELRTLLESGHVDIISSYWSEDDNSRFNSAYKTSLLSAISGSKWYLQEANRNIALKCAIQAELQNIAADKTGYYSQLILKSPCSEQ